jgi:hypothetical protein
LPVFGTDLEGLDRREGGKGLGTPGSQVEQRSMAWAFNGTGSGVELALGERAVIVRAAILDREQLASAVEYADLDPVDLDQAAAPLWELFNAAYGVLCHLEPVASFG